MSTPREPLLRFRLWVVLVWMAYVAFASAAFAVASGGWASAVSLSTLAAFAVTAVVVLCSQRGNRAFAAAFLVTGVTFLAACNGALRFLSVYPSDVPAIEWIDRVAEQAHPEGRSQQAVAERVLSHSVAIVLATLAAYLSRGIYILHQRAAITETARQY